MPSSVLAGSATHRVSIDCRPKTTGPVPEPSNAADLERAADEMLGRAVISGADSGIYTEAQLDRKMRDERKRVPELDECGVGDETVDCLLERLVEELIDVANLTAMQEIIYRLYVAGLSGRRISVVLGIRRRTVEWRLKTVKRKVRAACKAGRYAGWYEVYLSEVNRLAYRGRGNA